MMEHVKYKTDRINVKVNALKPGDVLWSTQKNTLNLIVSIDTRCASDGVIKRFTFLMHGRLWTFYMSFSDLYDTLDYKFLLMMRHQ